MADERAPTGAGSEFFTVRVWRESLTGDQGEWRGEVRHIPSGRQRFFRQWEMLVDFLRLTLEETVESDP